MSKPNGKAPAHARGSYRVPPPALSPKPVVVRVALTPELANALQAMADRDCRTPELQLRYLLVERIERETRMPSADDVAAELATALADSRSLDARIAQTIKPTPPPEPVAVAPQAPVRYTLYPQLSEPPKDAGNIRRMGAGLEFGGTAWGLEGANPIKGIDGEWVREFETAEYMKGRWTPIGEYNGRVYYNVA